MILYELVSVQKAHTALLEGLKQSDLFCSMQMPCKFLLDSRPHLIHNQAACASSASPSFSVQAAAVDPKDSYIVGMPIVEGKIPTGSFLGIAAVFACSPVPMQVSLAFLSMSSKITSRLSSPSQDPIITSLQMFV